ncbi:hypothetical protein [Nitrincola sp.]|uniref:hypothetical protein n=1 Tax=Nitrincola sp. TaxID=1926584 RepID=UPI003A8F85AB
MKKSAVTLDRVLYHILKEENVGYFTIMELREFYLKYVEPNGASLPQIRIYLYDQIRRMINLGWAAYHAERKSRGQRFLIKRIPSRENLKLVAPKLGMAERQTAVNEALSDLIALDRSNSDTTLTHPYRKVTRSAAEALEEMLKEVHLDFLTALGATERFKLLIDEIPELKGALEPELTVARDNSSRLLGHMNAIEAALHKIGAVR